MLVVHFLTHDFDEFHHVIGFAAGIGDDEVGVLGADLRAADFETLQGAAYLITAVLQTPAGTKSDGFPCLWLPDCIQK